MRTLDQAFEDLRDAAGTQDVARIVRLDLAFHAAIAAFIGSTRIDEFFAGLTRELQFFLTLLSVNDREYEDESLICKEHSVIYEAIRSGDRQAAQLEVERHIDVNHQRVREILAVSYT